MGPSVYNQNAAILFSYTLIVRFVTAQFCSYSTPAIVQSPIGLFGLRIPIILTKAAMERLLFPYADKEELLLLIVWTYCSRKNSHSENFVENNLPFNLPFPVLVNKDPEIINLSGIRID